MKPKILLSVADVDPKNYINAVKTAGGKPKACYLPEIDLSYDGLILCGGGDIDPFYYREEMKGSDKPDIKRDKAELCLAEAFIKAGKPVFGICRGMQLLNVYFGGSLYQHIECAHKHRSDKKVDLVHTVKAAGGTVCEILYGNTFSVNSYHHQALKDVGKGLEAVLFEAESGVKEGIEHSFLPIIGVQWHPERMCCEKARDDTVDGIKIIKYFIQLCKNKSS